MKKIMQKKTLELRVKEKLFEKCEKNYPVLREFMVILCSCFFFLSLIVAMLSILWIMDLIESKSLLIFIPIFLLVMGITITSSITIVNTIYNPQKIMKITSLISDKVKFKNFVLKLFYQNFSIKNDQISVIKEIIDTYPQLKNRVEFFEKKITKESFINILAEARRILIKEIKQLKDEIAQNLNLDLDKNEASFYTNMNKKGPGEESSENEKNEDSDFEEKIYRALFLISTSKDNKIRNLEKRNKEISRKIESYELSLTQDVIVKALYKEVKKDIVSLADTIENDQLGFDQEIIKEHLDQINAMFTKINKTLKLQKEMK